MNNENYETLETIFDKVNDWLKFAESKNAVLIALTGASLTAFLSYLGENDLPKQLFFKLYVYNFLIFSVIGISISLVSFLPQTKMLWLWREKNKIKNPNYFFFGDLAYLQLDELIKALYSENEKQTKPLQTVRKNIASQIINNSKICRRKFHFFRVALWFVLTSIFSPIISIVLYLIFDPNWNGTISN